MEFNLFHTALPNDEIDRLVVYSKEFDEYNEPFWKSTIEQTFSEEEIELLRQYFKVNYESDELIVKLAEPPTSNSMGDGARAVGGEDAFYAFCEVEGYNLPFKIDGYFRLDIKEDLAEPFISVPLNESDYLIGFNQIIILYSRCPICNHPSPDFSIIQIVEKRSQRPVCLSCVKKYLPGLYSKAKTLDITSSKPVDVVKPKDISSNTLVKSEDIPDDIPF
jgi:hypothetical protein